MSNTEREIVISYTRKLEQQVRELEERNSLLKRDNTALKSRIHIKDKQLSELQQSLKVHRNAYVTRKKRKIKPHLPINCSFQPAHRKVLDYFQNHPGSSFYSKEVETLIDGVTASPRMNELYRGGYLNWSHNCGTKVYYKFNPDHPPITNTIEFIRSRT